MDSFDYEDDDFFNYWDVDDDDLDDEGSVVEDDVVTGSEQSHAAQNSHFFSRKSLTDSSFQGPDPQIFQNLCKGIGITRPSKIQSLAWPILLRGKNTIIADQTGSGKTLAYLIPLIQRAIAAKSKEASGGKVYGAPRIIVLAPTAELADQTRAVCDKLSTHVPSFSTMVVTATGKYATSIRDQIRLLQRRPVDVLISTPGRLATILRTRNSGLDLSFLQSIVLDEVDVLLIDETFGPQLRTVGAVAPVARTQFVFCTATLPDAVVEQVEREFPQVQKITGPGLHRVAPTVKERLIDVSVPSKYNRDAKLCFGVKAKQLLKALRQVRCRRTLIFCNTVERCRQVENLLHRRDRKGRLYQVLSYHNAMTPESRNENLAAFAAQTDTRDSILVCTDRAARGVDFEAAPVDHVILFDFPKDPAEYVRRVGRTARAGRAGSSTVFCYGWQLPVARSVMGKQRVESFAATGDGGDDDADQEYLGGVKGRRRKQNRKGRDNSIKGNIKGGKLWSSRN